MFTCSCFESSSLRRLLGGYLPFFPLNLLLLLLYPCSPNNSSNKYKLKKYKGKENTSCSHISRRSMFCQLNLNIGPRIYFQNKSKG